MSEPEYRTAAELLARLEEGYRRHIAIRDRKVLEGSERTVRSLEWYEAAEFGMRMTIADARRALGLPVDEWLD